MWAVRNGGRARLFDDMVLAARFYLHSPTGTQLWAETSYGWELLAHTVEPRIGRRTADRKMNRETLVEEEPQSA